MTSVSHSTDSKTYSVHVDGAFERHFRVAFQHCIHHHETLKPTHINKPATLDDITTTFIIIIIITISDASLQHIINHSE